MGNNHPTLYKNFTTNQYKEGSVIVMTGAGSGMGKELAFRYAARPGTKLVLGDLNLKSIEDTK